MQAWSRAQVSDLVELCDAALPAERLTADELLAACWDVPGAVLATADGEGVVAVATRVAGDGRVLGAVTLLAVVPAAQSRGIGRALLAEAERWLLDAGADEVSVSPAPFRLWPGVDLTNARAVCLFDAAGYEDAGTTVHLSCPTTVRAPHPAGTVVRRVLDDPDADAVLAMVEDGWPAWAPEVGRAVEHGSCLAAFGAASDVVGFACHSVNRAGWVGPLATREGHRLQGIGAALLGESCKDLMVAGFTAAQITGDAPRRFFARAGRASVSRVFRSFRRPRDAAAHAGRGTR